MTARLYDLSSTWIFPHPQQQVWDVIADPKMSWPQWWPGCTLAKPLEQPAKEGKSNDELLLGTTATLNFKASLGYTLKVSYHPTKVVSPREVVFDAGGDLLGQGSVVLSPIDARTTRMDIDWKVRPTSRWMTLLSPVAAPAFKYAHSALMAKGERGLREFLATKELK